MVLILLEEYEIDFIQPLKYLVEQQEAGKITHLGLTNFNTVNLQRIVDAGIRVVSNQVSYSIIDTRPENAMVPLCKTHQITLLTYGTLLGGFLSEKWLRKKVEKKDLETVSQRKYLRFIQEWGSWELFQGTAKIHSRLIFHRAPRGTSKDCCSSQLFDCQRCHQVYP